MGTVSTTLPSDGQTIDASDVNTPINAILNEFNGNIDNDNIKSAANINGSKLANSSLSGSKFDTTTKSGWIAGALPSVSSVTYNGQRSYDITFASTVASLLTPGMRIRTTRTVTAPTQCADLEASSSQYFAKANATGFSTGTTWTYKAKIKLESYTLGVIAALDDGTNIVQMFVNASGQLTISGGTAATSDIVTSYQSLPLGRWVDVTASITIGTPTGEIRIDDVVVPSFVTASAATTVTINGDETFYIGRNATGSYFDGKVCQVAIFNAIISDATLKTYSSQTMTGAETNCKGFWSLNNTLNDLNASANNLTAFNSAVATNADSPFALDANGTPGGTYDYAIVTKVSTTTATVQVPEGCTIPTSGGVSTVDLSPHKAPFGMPVDEGRWAINNIISSVSTSGTSTSTVYNPNSTALTVPTGAWNISYALSLVLVTNANSIDINYGLSTSNSAFIAGDSALVGRTRQVQANSSTSQLVDVYKTQPVTLSSATPYYLLLLSTNAFTSFTVRSAISNSVPELSVLSATPAHL